MGKTTKELIQLQELCFALSEERALLPEAGLEELEQSIKALTEKLPRETSAMFQALQKRYDVVVVPEINGSCSACRIRLPSSQVAQIRSEDDVHQCQNCRRFLYHFEGKLHVSKSDRQPAEKPRVGIARFSAKELMQPSLTATRPDQAISELIDLMAANDYVSDTESLLAAALGREAITTTALGHGLAFPHARRDEGGGLILALGMSRKGFRFDPARSELTRIVFFMVIPSYVRAFYLQLLSGLIETFRQKSAQQELLKCETPEAMWTKLKALTRKRIS